MLCYNRGALSPWIESLIQSYGSEEGRKGRQLKALVIAVGEMSQSQARNAEGNTDLIFLSDGVVHIPTTIASSAWERLQGEEERECYSSLLNTTVWVKDYRLQFHMATEPTRCKFFLSAGDIITISVGPHEVNSPCCSALPSVQEKLYKTWRTLLVQETQDSQDSQIKQNDFNLSDLMGEWQRDSVQTVVADLKERLMMVRSANRQLSRSTGLTSVTQSSTFTPTSWDIERVQDNGAGCFSIPIQCLLMPEGQKENADTFTTDGDVLLNLRLSESPQSSIDLVDWQTAKLTEGGGEVGNCGDNITHHDNVCVELTNKDITPLEKPWEMFPPPNGFSFSGMSQEAIPIQSLQSDQQNSQVNITSTQLPIIRSTQTEDLQHSKGDHSSLPPYQKPPLSSDSSNTATPNSHTAPQGKQTIIEHVDAQQKTVGSQHRKSKRKRDQQCVQEAQMVVAVEEDEAQISPPSWLFDSVMTSGTVEGSIHVQTLGAEKRKILTVHADGEPFSYTYTVSGQNLQDFSKFQVAKSLLPWAIKYLVPKQTAHL